MHPAVKKIRLKMTNTGEKRIAYSQKEAISMSGIPLYAWKQWEEMEAIPPSIFIWGVPYYTLRQITLLKAWKADQLPQNVNPRAYLFQHWNDPDEEGA